MIEPLSDGALRVLLLDTKTENPNHYICLAVQRALAVTPGVELVIKADLHDAIAEAQRHRCNLFFAFDGEELERTICARLAAVCGKAILWVTEDPYEVSVNVANSALFDLVFTNDSACVSAYGDKGRHLPLAGAKPFHLLPVKAPSTPLRYDLFFAGTAWPNRVALLKDFLAADWGEGGIKTKIALPSNPHLPAVDLGLPDSQLNWRTSPLDFARFANASTATLLLPRVFSSSGERNFAETPPPRLYEAALAGTVQLVQSNVIEAANYFEPGKEFLYFDTARELIDMVRALRADRSMRDQMAERAQAKALAQHCYEHRMLEVIAAVRQLSAATPARSPVRSATWPRVMLVAHNVVANGHFGGVEVYMDLITRQLGTDCDVYFYVPNRLCEPDAALVMDRHGAILRQLDFSSSTSPWQLSCPEREAAFAGALIDFDITFVHFHHLINHVPSLVEIAKSVGVATAMTFHDFFALCHNFTLLSFKGSYCQPDQIPIEQCDVCLWNGHLALPGGQAARRAYWDSILRQVDTLVFNTEGARALSARIYPAVAEHARALILPVPMVPVRDKELRLRQVPPALKVAILGNFTWQKGANVMARVIPLLANANIEFHIFGRVEADYAWLNNAATMPHVHVHGAYQPGALPKELFYCHVSLHLSIWPETYCLTLSEAWECGLVPIVTDIGALGERVVDGETGLKIAPDSEGCLVQAIRRLAETPGLLTALQNNICAAPISRLEPHLAQLRTLYAPASASAASYIACVPGSGAISLARLGRPAPAPWSIRPRPVVVAVPEPIAVEVTVQAVAEPEPVALVLIRPLPPPRLYRRLLGVSLRGLLHYRVHGVRAAARATVRFIVKRL